MTVTQSDNLPQGRLHDALTSYLSESLLHNDAPKRTIAIESLVDEFPDSALQYDDRGRLPIHVACEEGLPLGVIQCLLQTWPDTIESPTKRKRQMIPLHVVCRHYNGSNCQKSAVIQHMLTINPWAARTTTAAGETPLHCLLQNYFCTLADVKLLVNVYPEALDIATKKGYTPLHIACEMHYMERSTKRARPTDDNPSSSSADIIAFLLKHVSPEALGATNSKGELPLHSAVRSHQSLDTIRGLLSAYPDASKRVDRRGRTALHLATARHSLCRKTVRYLIQANQSAVHQKDNDGSTPRILDARQL